jgi:hypothetical protein
VSSGTFCRSHISTTKRCTVAFSSGARPK